MSEILKLQMYIANVSSSSDHQRTFILTLILLGGDGRIDVITSS